MKAGIFRGHLALTIGALAAATGCVHAPLANTDIHDGEGPLSVVGRPLFPDPDNQGQLLANLQVEDENVEALREVLGDALGPGPHLTLRLQGTNTIEWPLGTCVDDQFLPEESCIYPRRVIDGVPVVSLFNQPPERDLRFIAPVWDAFGPGQQRVLAVPIPFGDNALDQLRELNLQDDHEIRVRLVSDQLRLGEWEVREDGQIRTARGLDLKQAMGGIWPSTARTTRLWS